ncbi:MAG: aspartate carbamoyltransferase catalytic subunit [Clostridia bacterium]|nr:aspartate carbamoyltransferase catalytic subunit [Clostridia bacterium]
MSRNLLTLDLLSPGEIHCLLEEADSYRCGAAFPNLSGKVACNLFFEASTRTQYSFCVAQEKMRMRVVTFHPETSSLCKNESFYDTVKVFDSFRPDALVIRHAENAYYNRLLSYVRAPIVNGGDGTGDHPTQSLIDLLTIHQEFGRLDGLKVTMIGDIRHSRVAHSNYRIMRRFGMDVVTAGPDEYLDTELLTEAVDSAVATSDIVMPLRVQLERHAAKSEISASSYLSRYGITMERIGKMKPGAVLMHPAPFNRDVEIADEVVECERSRIFKQMENGVFIRMAVMRRAVES